MLLKNAIFQYNSQEAIFQNIATKQRVIKRVDKTKYLGINIDESLNWKEQ